MIKLLQAIPGLFCPQIRNYEIIKETIKNNYSCSKGNIKINLLVCDALDAIKKLKLKFDIIFHDPFSPRKNPELWTEEFFKELRKHIKADGILTTYSCAGVVRRNLKAAGFEVKDGPCIGRRSPSTIVMPL